MEERADATLELIGTWRGWEGIASFEHQGMLYGLGFGDSPSLLSAPSATGPAAILASYHSPYIDHLTLLPEPVTVRTTSTASNGG